MPETTAPLSPRRRALLDAAESVAAAQGLRGLTHRAVDAAGGFPAGTCSAYFRTRQALLVALAEYVCGGLSDDVTRLGERLERHPGDADLAVSATLEMFTAWLRHPETQLARLELTLEASRSPALAQVIDVVRADLVAHVRTLVEVVESGDEAGSAGPDDALVRADILVAALDGVLATALRQPERRRRAFLRDALSRLVDVLRH